MGSKVNKPQLQYEVLVRRELYGAEPGRATRVRVTVIVIAMLALVMVLRMSLMG